MPGELARREAANIGAHWAAESHPDPAQVWREWDSHLMVACLPTGRSWDAVVISDARMQAVVQDGSDPDLLTHAAILTDTGRRVVYLFTPTGTADAWSVPGTTALGEGGWLVASQPGYVERQRSFGAWLQVATLRNPLVDADRLRAALLRTAEAHP